MSRVLHLNLYRRYFDLIASGIKKEEYRSLTKYWRSRLLKPEYRNLSEVEIIRNKVKGQPIFTDRYNVIRFMNGYSKLSPVMEVELLGIHYGPVANIDWIESVTQEWFFCIELGKILSIKNYKQLT